MKTAAIFAMFFFILVSASIAWGDPVTDTVIKGLAKHYAEVEDIQADFSQKTMVKTLGREQVKTGTVKFKRPGMMRWDYKKPTGQQLITDGFSLWVYNPEDKTVFMRKVDKANSTNVLIQILSGKVDVSKEFNAKAGEIKDGKHRLILRPKDRTTGYEKAVLHIDEKTFRIENIEVWDLYGNETNTTLSNVKYNSKLKSSLFVFTPKAGVEVISPPVMD